MRWDVAALTSEQLSIFMDLVYESRQIRRLDFDNWAAIAQHLIRTGRQLDAIAVLTEAIVQLPAEPRLQVLLALVWVEGKQRDTAREILARLPHIASDDRLGCIARLELLLRLEAGAELETAATELLSLDPTHAHALAAMGLLARQRDQPHKMLPLCRAALEIEPYNTGAYHEFAVALSLLGRTAEARQLIDVTRFVTVSDLTTPAAFVDAAAFEAALASEIGNNPTLRLDPAGKATRGGQQTADGLPHRCEPAMAMLLDLVRQAVDDFESKLPLDSACAFVDRRPKAARINAWAVVYPGGGRQLPHIHPDGWLSGVVCIRAPQVPPGGRGGNLVLGALEIDGREVAPAWGIREIRPVPGRLVLFPSYMPHATVPTNATGDRICVSFDIIPVPAP